MYQYTFVKSVILYVIIYMLQGGIELSKQQEICKVVAI